MVHPDGDEYVVLSHLVEMRDAQLVGAEGRHVQLAVDEVDVAVVVGHDHLAPPAGARRHVHVLRQTHTLISNNHHLEFLLPIRRTARRDTG